MGDLPHIGIMLCIYGILVVSTNLTVGMANLLTLCQAAFYGIGAYVGAFFLKTLALPLWQTALLAFVATGLFSLIISFASTRLKGDYFILATLGFQLIVYTILYNWSSVTGGNDGLGDIPRAGISDLGNSQSYLIISAILLLVTLLVFTRIQKSPFGRLLKAIKDDELAVQTLGRNTSAVKAKAFFISSAFAGLAGIIYASYVGVIHPDNYTLEESIFIITALFIGGAGDRVRGPLAGAAFVVLLPVLLRLTGMPKGIIANFRQVVYGIVIVALAFFRPQGLLGRPNKN